MASAVLAFGAVGLVLLYGVLRLLRVGRRPPGLPPGPPTIPILGNLHLVSRSTMRLSAQLILLKMPTRDAHLQFKQWVCQELTQSTIPLG